MRGTHKNHPTFDENISNRTSGTIIYGKFFNRSLSLLPKVIEQAILKHDLSLAAMNRLYKEHCDK